MRRFIAYSTIAAGLLVAVGVSVTPLMNEIKPGREFTTSHEVRFEIQSKDEQKLPDNAATIVADEMRNRLDNFDLEDYSVKIQNTGSNINDEEYQVVSVNLSCKEDTFNKVCTYLQFSGRNLSISTAGEDETNFVDDVFDYDNVYTKTIDSRVPVVVIPLKDADKSKEKIEKIIETISGGQEENTEKAAPKRVTVANAEGEDDASETKSEPDLFIWGNHDDSAGENYSTAQTDPNIASKIILPLYSSQIWYTKADGATSDEDGKCIKVICGSMNGENYDFDAVDKAFEQAKYIENMFKAKAYDYEITCPTANVTTSGIDFYKNAIEVVPETKLVDHVNPKNGLNVIVISSIIALAIIIIALVAYYKLLSIGMIATSITTLFLSLFIFIKLGATFAIPTLVGALLVFGTTLFTEILHVNRFRNEVYKGRTLKKANQEAGKKTNLVVLDAAVITSFTGLMFYVFGGINGGYALRPFGSLLFFAGFVILLMYLIVFKLLMHLLTNSTDLQKSYKGFNISEAKIPNLMLDQKETYVAPFEKVRFTKPSKIVSIILAALSVASIVGIVVFGVKNGSPLNIQNEINDKTVIYTSLRATDSKVTSDNDFKMYILNEVDSIKEQMESEEDLVKLTCNEVTKYDSVTKTEVKSLDFTVEIDYEYKDLDLIKNEVSEAMETQSIASENYDVKVVNSHETIYTPNQGIVALATAVSIVGAAIYLMLRYKPSRGLAVLSATTVATLASYGIAALAHIPTNPVAALAMPVTAITVLVASLFILSQEKILRSENHEELTPEVRKEIMIKSIGKAALPSFIFLFITAFTALVFFGFGLKQTSILFAGSFIGEVIGGLALFVVTGPLAELISKMFKSIKLPKPKWLVKKQQNVPYQVKKNSSEPEETIFIGIND